MYYRRYDIENATALHLTFNTSVTGSAIPSSFVERFIHSEVSICGYERVDHVK